MMGSITTVIDWMGKSSPVKLFLGFALVVYSLFLFEQFTDHFRLNRLNKAVSVMESMEGTKTYPLLKAQIEVETQRLITAVDEGVGRILATLKEEDLMDNTIIVFAGDNGYFFSEHGGLHDKRKAYEPSMRIPLLMYYPGHYDEHREIDEMVLNVDLAPTLLTYAGARVPGHMQGEDWSGLVEGTTTGRDAFLYEYYRETDYRRRGGFGNTPTILALRSNEWKYVTYPDGRFDPELYHLVVDPDELYNVIHDPSCAEALADMKERFALYLDRYGYEAPEKLQGGGISHDQLYGGK